MNKEQAEHNLNSPESTAQMVKTVGQLGELLTSSYALSDYDRDEIARLQEEMVADLIFFGDYSLIEGESI